MKRLRDVSDAFPSPAPAVRMRTATNAAAARLLTAEGPPAPANRGRDETVEISSQLNKAATGENLPGCKPTGAGVASGRYGSQSVIGAVRFSRGIGLPIR